MKKYVKPTLEFVELIAEERLATSSGGCVKVTGWGDGWNDGKGNKCAPLNTPSS